MQLRAFPLSLIFLAACEVSAPVAPSPQPQPIASEVPTPEGLRFAVEPAVAAPGSTVTLLLDNGSPHQIGYNLCDSTLEQWQGDFWSEVPQEIVCTQELRILSSGQVAQYERELPGRIPAGDYRFRTGIEAPLNGNTPGLDRIASEPFVVRH